MTDDDTGAAAAYERGRALRRAVMGDAHVSRSGGDERADASALQRYVTEFGWGTVWQRGVLPLPTRSLLTVVMLIALNRPHELAGHLSGALNNDCTEETLREAIIHAVPYCGFPAAIDAMRVFDRVLAERAESGAAGS